jgi:hypothetical protein
MIRDAGNLALVAEADGDVVGNVLVSVERSVVSDHVGTLSICVADGWREVGIGSALVAGAQEWSRQRGLAKVALGVFPDNERANVPWEIFDCRLVLALHDWSETLRAHSIAEVRIFSAWRPPAKSWPMDEWGRRHQGALAVDVRELRKDTGEVLNVLDHFHGQLGAPQCTSNAAKASPDTPEAQELHDLVCAASEARIFNSILTPNYNSAHRNHFHLEVTPDVDWFMLR